MGLTKGKGKKTSDFKTVNENQKGKELGNLLTAMEQSGLTKKDKNAPLGVSIKGKNSGDAGKAMPGLANMFLKIPGVRPKDLAGIDPDELNNWIENSPESLADAAEGNRNRGGGNGGLSGRDSPLSTTVPPRAVKGPGWISITRLLGRVRV